MTTGYDELERQLRAAVVARSSTATRRAIRWPHWPTPVVIAAMLGAGGAATAGAVALTNHLSGVDESPPTAPDATFQQSLEAPEITAYGGSSDTAKTTRVEVDGRQWSFAWRTNGVLCVQFPGKTTSCATPSEVADGDLTVTVIAPPTREQQRRRAEIIRAMGPKGGPIPSEAALPPAPATRYGIATDSVAEVRAIGHDGAQIATATPVRNTYVLRIGLEGEAERIEFVGADGGVIATAQP